MISIFRPNSILQCVVAASPLQCRKRAKRLKTAVVGKMMQTSWKWLRLLFLVNCCRHRTLCHCCVFINSGQSPLKSILGKIPFFASVYMYVLVLCCVPSLTGSSRREDRQSITKGTAWPWEFEAKGKVNADGRQAFSCSSFLSGLPAHRMTPPTSSVKPLQKQP